MCQAEPLIPAHQGWPSVEAESELPSGFDKGLKESVAQSGSKNQSEICTEDSADLRTNLLHTSFGGHPSSNPAQTRYLPPRALLGGLYASVSADHETKAVQGLKHNAGNTSNNFSPTNLPPPLVTRLKAILQRDSCVQRLSLKHVLCGHSHSEVRSATVFQEGCILTDG